MAAFIRCRLASRSAVIIGIIFSCILCKCVYLFDVDPNGYVVYCPCMGRFGNQADHFLGAFGFAHALQRTLVLPPWVEYNTGSVRSVQVPFDTYFDVEPLKEFHKVITMEDFTLQLAPAIWPVGNRTVFCYMPRENSDDCKAKEGNPFGPFWDTYNIDFTSSEFFGPLNYDMHHGDMKKQWSERYPASKYPVLAFMGAPASFPVQPENRDLHKFLHWSNIIMDRAMRFIKNVLPRGPFVGVHFRNGIDWERACQHVEASPNLFSAPQCLGYQNQFGLATAELCLPSKQTISRQIKKVVKKIGAVAIFVASDNDYMIDFLSHSLRKFKVGIYRREPAEAHVDLAILGRSNHFIGNCISSFSAFVKRERDANGFPSSFWAFPLEDYAKSKSNRRDEL